MPRRGPGLQDTAPFRLPQNLLMTFLLSERKVAPPATQPRPSAVSRAETQTSAAVEGEKARPTTILVARSIAPAGHGHPSPC